jgi:act minimal PKS chain-length factor (CLF/KS beta)
MAGLMSRSGQVQSRALAGGGSHRRGQVVITGVGIAAPNGLGQRAYWDAALRGTSAIGRITRFDPTPYPARLAAELRLDTAPPLPSRLLPQTDRVTRANLLAADEALSDARLDLQELPYFAAGVVTAASAGGFEFGQRELENLWSKGSEYVSAYQSFAWFYPVNSGQVSIRHQLHGPGGAIVSEQAGGLDALAMARRHVRGGTALMVAGAVDGSLCPWGWLCLLRSGRLSTRDDPRLAYQPFDAGACGHVPGEGGALLIVEDEAHARERGAGSGYGELAGYAATFDARDGYGTPDGLRRAVELALADAGMRPADVDVVFADAAGVPELDRAEAEMIAAVFGPRAVPVAAPKTMTGRLLAGGAALDVATALLAMRDSVIPPAVNVTTPAYGQLIDLVRDAPRQVALTSALIVARGQGGFNSALAVRKLTAQHTEKGGS